jgi:regulator of extracellular matrix RemA (YlzA/DUF370 family)
MSINTTYGRIIGQRAFVETFNPDSSEVKRTEVEGAGDPAKLLATVLARRFQTTNNTIVEGESSVVVINPTSKESYQIQNLTSNPLGNRTSVIAVLDGQNISTVLSIETPLNSVVVLPDSIRRIIAQSNKA